MRKETLDALGANPFPLMVMDDPQTTFDPRNKRKWAEVLAKAANAAATDKHGNACSVTLDGRLVCSCLMLAVEAEGHKIETIEGMARGHDLHPLQRKFLEHAALQCGFCTPGLLVAAKALLDRNPNPTETEARYWLAGNLCRCTGYDKVIRAVLDAAAELRAE